MNINYFLNEKLDEVDQENFVREEALYDDISDDRLKRLFGVMHKKLNSLLKFLKIKSKSNKHYNAVESRQLLSIIELYENMQHILKNSELAFELNDEYANMLEICNSFLQESGGSAIPDNLPEITFVEYDPIFYMTETIDVQNIANQNNYKLKLIGSGSYANVYKYKDSFYNKKFVLKQAKKELNEKELDRFKREFEVMNLLKSPYVLEVYAYNDKKNEYIMEYADETIYDFINKNNNSLNIEKRKNIVYQILKGFQYIHSKNYLHRDISFTNILLQQYDNDLSVVKISDFGLVKITNSNLTSIDTDIKGSLNDSNLSVIGFKNYSIVYETYAITRLIYFIMTGRYSLENISDHKIKKFIETGLSSDTEKRYQDIEELKKAFSEAF